MSIEEVKELPLRILIENLRSALSAYLCMYESNAKSYEPIFKKLGIQTAEMQMWHQMSRDLLDKMSSIGEP